MGFASLNDQYRTATVSEQLKIGFGPGMSKKFGGSFQSKVVQPDSPRRSAIDVEPRPRITSVAPGGTGWSTNGVRAGIYGR